MNVTPALPPHLRAEILGLDDKSGLPAVLYTDASGGAAHGLVLLCHGGSQHKFDPGVIALASMLVGDHRMAVAVLDGPIHGARRETKTVSRPAMQAEFLAFWNTAPAIDAVVADWRRLLDQLQSTPAFAGLRAGWLGLSMGTAYGVPLLAAEPRLCAAVLGMWGLDAAHGARLRADAARIGCPVLFQQKSEDAFFSQDGQRSLFDAVGAEDRQLNLYPGGHDQPAGAQLRDLGRFLADHLSDGAHAG